MIYFLITFFITTLISLGIIIFKRYIDVREYVILEITPCNYNNNTLLIDKMGLFFHNIKSIPVDSYYNVILEYHNQNNITSFRIYTPVDYKDSISSVISSNFPEFPVNYLGTLSENEFQDKFYGFYNFRTDTEIPFIKEELNKDTKLIENIKTIVSSIHNGVFQIMLNFDQVETYFTSEEEVSDVKVGNSMVAQNINLVKDIGVAFRFLTYEPKMDMRTLPSAIGGILNLGGKSNILSKVFIDGELTTKTISFGDTIKDFFHRLLYGNLPRLHTFSQADMMLFSSKEISYLFTFITGSSINSINYKPLNPSKVINKIAEKEKVLGADKFTTIGLIDYPGVHKVGFKVDPDVIRRHVYIIGKTGTGKSTILEEYITNDIKSGNGFALFDPNGDLAKKVLDSIPESRKNDVIYIDPTNPNGLVCLSIYSFLKEIKLHQEMSDDAIKTMAKNLGYITQDYQKFNIDYNLMTMIVDIIKNVSVGGRAQWGARMDALMKNVGAELLGYKMSEIIDVSSYFNNSSLRKNIIANIEDPVLYEELNNFERKDDKQREEAYQPVRNRFTIFQNETLQHIFSGDPKFSLKSIMDEGKILIFRLPKGYLGEAGNLIGSIMIGLFWALAQTRVSQNEEDRKDFTLYIDEVQNFVTDTFSGILEEARKYRLRLVMANQFTRQIKDRNPNVYNSIIGNIGTIIALQIGMDDANDLKDYFGVDPVDMVNIPLYKAFVKCPHYSNEPFNIMTRRNQIDQSVQYPGYLNLMNISREKYAVDIVKNSNDESFEMKKIIFKKFFSQRETISMKEFEYHFGLNQNSGKILLSILEMESIVRIDYETCMIYSLGFGTKVEDVTNSDVYSFKYSKEEIKSKPIVSVRSYFERFKKLPPKDFIKLNFSEEENIQEVKDDNLPVSTNVFGGDFQITDDKQDQEIISKIISLLYENNSISHIARTLKISWINAEKFYDHIMVNKMVDLPDVRNQPKTVEITSKVDIPSDLELPKEEGVLGKLLSAQNKEKEITESQSETIVDIGSLDVFDVFGNDFGNDFGDLSFSEIQESPKKEREEFYDFVYKGKQYFQIENKHPNLEINDNFFSYKITEDDIGKTLREFSQYLGFTDTKYFLDFVGIGSVVTDINFTIKRNLLGKTIKITKKLDSHS